MKSNASPSGYIALIALLLVTTAALTIGLAVSLRGLNELQAGLAVSEAAVARSTVNACVEDGLERLRGSWANYSGTLSTGNDLCTIMVTISGNSATVSASSTSNGYTQSNTVQVSNQLEIVNWRDE